MKRALVLLLALVAAGCSASGSSSPPAALPPISATPATTGPAQPVPSDPEAARASAGDFARTWVETLNEAYGTLDTTALSAMSAPECVTCQAYINAMAESKAAGQRWVGGTQTVSEAVAAPLAGEATEVLVTYSSTAFYVLEPTGRRTDPQPAQDRGAMEVSVKRVGQAWQTTEVVQL